MFKADMLKTRSGAPNSHPQAVVDLRPAISALS